MSDKTIYGPLTPCKVSEKNIESILRNLLTDGRTDERTDGQTLFHRTLPAEAGGPIISFDDQNFGFDNFSYFSSYCCKQHG